MTLMIEQNVDCWNFGVHSYLSDMEDIYEYLIFVSTILSSKETKMLL